MASVSNVINRVKYVSEDFSTYRLEAEEFFQQYYPEEFNNVINTDLGNAMIDQIAFAMQALTFSMNRRASELFLSSARLTKSITKLARMLGYPIKPASPATVDATCVLTDGAAAYPVTFEKGFSVYGPGDIIYEYRNESPFVIPAGSVSGIIPLKEGKTKTIVYISDGTENQEFSIVGIPTGEYLYSDVEVTVDGVLWTRTGLLSYDSTNIYEVLFTEDPPKLRFGDGVLGNVPALGAQITVKIAYGKGLQGSIGTNQLSNPVSKIFVNGTEVKMKFTNPVATIGENPEDIRHVKAFASSFFRTQNAAVVKTDYDTISLLEPGVAIADAQVMRGVSGDITIQGKFADINTGMTEFENAAVTLISAYVTGVPSLGVSGISALYVGGVSSLSVSGIDSLSVSGTSYLGWNGSFVTGLSYLGVAGSDQLVVGNTGMLFVGGENELGVSGVSSLGIKDYSSVLTSVGSASGFFNVGIVGLEAYLSQVYSDTSKANNVQVVLLAVDSNNKYISPSSTIINNVQQRLQKIADAVVTVTAVDGSSLIIGTDMTIEIGLSPTANESDVIQKVTAALTRTTSPYGVMVRRKVGASVYLSDIIDSIRSEVGYTDIVYMVPIINSPLNKTDIDGNLIISKQEVSQLSNLNVKVVRRFKRGEVY